MIADDRTSAPSYFKAEGSKLFGMNQIGQTAIALCSLNEYGPWIVASGTTMGVFLGANACGMTNGLFYVANGKRYFGNLNEKSSIW